MKCLMSPQETNDVGAPYLWPRAQTVGQLVHGQRVQERGRWKLLKGGHFRRRLRPKNGSEIANCNSLWVVLDII